MLSLETAISCMSILAEMGNNKFLSNLGISETAWNLITGPKPWTNNDRMAVTKTMYQLIHASMDESGIPRIEVSAEWVASAICQFVHPSNIHKACRYLERDLKTAEQLGDGVDNAEPVSARRLFALCNQLYRLESASHCRSVFARKTKLKLADAKAEEETMEKIRKGLSK
jgi:hypothetical protein